MPSYIKSVTFDCHEPLVVAAFWAEALGSNVDEDSTPDRAWVEPAGQVRVTHDDDSADHDRAGAEAESHPVRDQEPRGCIPAAT